MVLAGYFIRRLFEDAPALSIKTNMFAYDCQNPVKPHVRADGELHRCVAENIDEMVEFTRRSDMFLVFADSYLIKRFRKAWRAIGYQRNRKPI